MRAVPSRPWRRRRWLTGVAVVVAAYVLVGIVSRLGHHQGPAALTFNSMLDHLLHGRFDVDPAAVGEEGFAREGRVYAYWGVLPALLRLPVALLPGWRALDFTAGFCVVALLLMAAVKLWTVRLVLRHNPAVPPALARATYVVIGLSGAQTCFLRFNLYQEVCFWAGLCGAVFVAAAVSAQHRGLGERQRLIMAAAAGAALLTRVSTGIGLIAAFGLLLLAEGWRGRADWRAELRRSALPLLVVAAAGLATATVNYGRWGNPLTFADYQLYIFNQHFPDRLARTAAYGLFNLQRIPFGLVYYLLPVWVLRGQGGELLFARERARLIDSAELPPSSFLLTDPLLLLLAASALAGWIGRRPGALRGGAVAAGLTLPPLLMLTAISMCHRYRIDFYPLIEFLAFSGLAMVGGRGLPSRPRLVWTLTAVSVACSLAVGILYVVGRLGPAHLLIGQGVGRYFLGRFGLG